MFREGRKPKADPMAKRTPGIPGPSPCHEPFGWSGLLQEADRLSVATPIPSDRYRNRRCDREAPLARVGRV